MDTDRRVRPLFEPLKPISPGRKVALGILGFVIFFALWSLATYGGWVRPLFLASPGRTLVTGYELFVEFNFILDVGVTIWRVFGGFLIAAAIAVPLGIAMGAFKPVEALFEPFVSFSRYLPASAFIPLLILWAGVGEAQKLSVIFIGSVFQLILMIAVIVGSVRLDLVEAAYTLGAGRDGIVLRVLLPAAAPQIFEALRLVLGWAWTYVIVAELIGASSGIGHMIMDAQRLLDTGQMIFGIFVIGLIGLISDFLFKTLNERLFPWYAAK
jgi:NitT/TauT family transport system permease protein